MEQEHALPFEACAPTCDDVGDDLPALRSAEPGHTGGFDPQIARNPGFAELPRPDEPGVAPHGTGRVRSDPGFGGGVARCDGLRARLRA